MKVFFFGMGFSSLAAARAMRTGISTNLPIAGTTRDPEVGNAEFKLHAFDGKAAGGTLGADLRRATHLVISIPPDENGDPVLRNHRSDMDAAPDLQWLCYYSTVGVYGDLGGAWIDETAATHPQNRRSQLRLKVEQEWRDYAARRGVPLLILRLAGIYGPGRSSIDKLRAGVARRIIKPEQVFNRIHVEDIARITMLAAKARLAGTFNLADDEPAPPQDVIAFAAELIGMPAPPGVPFAEANMTSMARSFYADNKRVSNAAIKAALGIELLYPTFREGLRAIHQEHA